MKIEGLTIDIDDDGTMRMTVETDDPDAVRAAAAITGWKVVDEKEDGE